MSKPPFLKGSGDSDSASASGSGGKFENRPQESGSTNEPDGSDEDRFPNRPQESGGMKGNPQSVPSGGKLPYKGAPASPGKPFKLKG
jgi:hypothetical protein